MLDYKSSLSLDTEPEKREFIKDVVSFANSAGGTLLYGVQEEDLIATALPGIGINDKDTLFLRLEEVLRTGINPRVEGIKFQEVPVENEKFVLIVSVPQSFRSPHMIIKGHHEFYARGETSNFRMDVRQLRDAFLESESITTKAHNFRIDRLAKIAVGDTPIPLKDKTARLVLHIMPAFSLAHNASINLAKFFASDHKIIPREDILSHRTRYCLDGIIQSSTDEEIVWYYSLFFRNGCVEIVDAASCDQFPGSQIPFFYPHTYEPLLRDALTRAIQSFIFLEIPEPYFVGLSVLSCKGFGLFRGTGRPMLAPKMLPVDQMILPETSIEVWDGNVDSALKPLFDMIWNAFGNPRSLNYDEQGVWTPQRR